MDASPSTVYEKALRQWNPKINLVSAATLDDFHTRHWVDSAKIFDFIPQNARVLMDGGSGAGVPGMVLALLRPETEMHLVESDARKCAFLRHVSRETERPVQIHNTRIESLDPEKLRPDLITSRALAPLSGLLSWAQPFAAANPDLLMLFLKGRNWRAELEAARAAHSFQCTDYPSRTDPESRILKISLDSSASAANLSS